MFENLLNWDTFDFVRLISQQIAASKIVIPLLFQKIYEIEIDKGNQEKGWHVRQLLKKNTWVLGTLIILILGTEAK